MEKKIPVMVTTEYRGVFFGYVPKVKNAKSIRLTDARMAVYWSKDMGGVLGLATIGPSATCKIGPKVPAIELSKVTAVVEVSVEAASKWESAPMNF